MRVVKEIQHHTFKITVFSWNGKYLIKVELGGFEQTYKIDELSVNGLSDLEKMLDEEFYLSCMKRFNEMRTSWKTAFDKTKKLT